MFAELSRAERRAYADRFWARGDRSGGPDACWPWTGTVRADGYAHVYLRGAAKRAHRVALELVGRRLNPALTVNHVCHDRDLSCAGGPSCLHRRCCNPRHLRQTTVRANVRGGRSAAASVERWARRTRCVNGHALTADNVRVDPRRRQRHCRKCQADNARRYRENLRRRPRPQGAAQSKTRREKPRAAQGQRRARVTSPAGN